MNPTHFSDDDNLIDIERNEDLTISNYKPADEELIDFANRIEDLNWIDEQV